MGLSAVCAYNLSTAEAVFSQGKYMQSTTVEQSHTKWVRYNGAVPTPRPGAVSGPGRGGRGVGPGAWLALRLARPQDWVSSLGCPSADSSQIPPRLFRTEVRSLTHIRS